jgi:hypothetical protein
MRLLFVRHGQMDFDGNLDLDADTINQWFNAERRRRLVGGAMIGTQLSFSAGDRQYECANLD